MTAPVDTTDAPAGLAERGATLWREWVTPDHRLSPGHLVLVAEAARIADRLERLDAFLRGDAREWVHFAGQLAEGADMRVTVDGALVEARQQALALKALVAEIRQGQAWVAERPGAAADDAPTAKEDRLANVLQLVAQPARRGAAPAG